MSNPTSLLTTLLVLFLVSGSRNASTGINEGRLDSTDGEVAMKNLEAAQVKMEEKLNSMTSFIDQELEKSKNSPLSSTYNRHKRMADDDSMTIPKEVIFQIIASMEALMDAFSVLQTAYDGYKLAQSGKDIGPPLNLNSGEYDDIVESEARLEEPADGGNWGNLFETNGLNDADSEMAYNEEEEAVSEAGTEAGQAPQDGDEEFSTDEPLADVVEAGAEESSTDDPQLEEGEGADPETEAYTEDGETMLKEDDQDVVAEGDKMMDEMEEDISPAYSNQGNNYPDLDEGEYDVSKPGEAEKEDSAYPQYDSSPAPADAVTEAESEPVSEAGPGEEAELDDEAAVEAATESDNASQTTNNPSDAEADLGLGGDNAEDEDAEEAPANAYPPRIMGKKGKRMRMRRGRHGKRGQGKRGGGGGGKRGGGGGKRGGRGGKRGGGGEYV